MYAGWSSCRGGWCRSYTRGREPSIPFQFACMGWTAEMGGQIFECAHLRMCVCVCVV